MENALFSLGATFQAAKQLDEPTERLLKGAALLYPHLVLFAKKQTCDNLTEQITEGILKRHRKKARLFLLPISEVDPRWSNDQNTGDIAEQFDKWALSEDNPLEVSFLSEVFREWLILNKLSRGDKHVILTHPLMVIHLSTANNLMYHEDAATSLDLLAELQRIKSETSASTELEVAIPNIAELTWDEIWELRHSTYIAEFRKFMRHHVTREGDAEDIGRRIADGLWEVVGKTRPSRFGSVFSRIAGQIPLPIPLPIPNPLSIYRDVKDGYEERKRFQDYGWLYFIQEARTIE
jgi:hypothetical protein